MSFLDKLMFWKKSEDSFDEGSFDLSNFGKEDPSKSPADMFGASHNEPASFGDSATSASRFGSSNFGPPKESSFPQPSFPAGSPSSPQSYSGGFGTSQGFNSEKASSADLQLISAKLDTLKVMLENLSARLAHIEQINAQEHVELTQGRPNPQVRWNY